MTEEIEKIIGYKFKDRELCDKAFRHSSYAFLKGEENNEKLEFLGDSVLNYAVTEYLFFNVSGKTEGQLSKIKAKAVSTETLAAIVDDLGLWRYLHFSTESVAEKHSKKTRANLFEALLAAITVDGGIAVGKQFALTMVAPYIKQIMSSDVFYDYKTALQEYAQSKKLSLSYHLVSKTGADHSPTFCFEVKLDGKTAGRGEGGSKSDAQIAAAKNAYESINTERNRG